MATSEWKAMGMETAGWTESALWPLSRRQPSGSITYIVARDPVYLVASPLLLVLELAALTPSLSYLFGIVDTLSTTPIVMPNQICAGMRPGTKAMTVVAALSTPKKRAA